jgi:hypothetical protein
MNHDYLLLGKTARKALATILAATLLALAPAGRLSAVKKGERLLGPNPSQAFVMLIMQMERDWMASKGLNLERSAPKLPITVAISLGFALRGQLLAVEKDQSQQAALNQLLRECEEFLGRVAQAANYWDQPNKQRVSMESLRSIANASMRGKYDQTAKKKFDRVPSPQRSILKYIDKPAYPSGPKARSLEPSRQDSDSINLLGQDTDTTVQSNQGSQLADRILGNWDNHLSGSFDASCTVSKQNGKYVVMGQNEFGRSFGAVLRYNTVTGNPKGSFCVHFKVEQCMSNGVWKNAGDKPCLYEYSNPATGDTFYDYQQNGTQENFGLSACGQTGTFRR